MNIDAEAVIEQGNMELSFADELYYTIYRKANFFATKEVYGTLDNLERGTSFLTIFTSIEKAGGFLFSQGVSRENVSVHKISGANDAIAIAESVKDVVTGIAVNPPMDSQGVYMVMPTQALADWGTSRQ